MSRLRIIKIATFLLLVCIVALIDRVSEVNRIYSEYRKRTYLSEVPYYKLLIVSNGLDSASSAFIWKSANSDSIDLGKLPPPCM